jgi:hypothetical protein
MSMKPHSQRSPQRATLVPTLCRGLCARRAAQAASRRRRRRRLRAGSTAAAHAVCAVAGRARGLDAAFRATLARGIHGLCFSPYLEGQQPGSQIGEAQIRERLAHRAAAHALGAQLLLHRRPRADATHRARDGLKTLVGAWLGTDPEINEREIAGVIAVARAGHADIVAVGNEVLLREDLSRRRTHRLHRARSRPRCPACRWAMSMPTTCSRSTRASPPPATWS